MTEIPEQFLAVADTTSAVFRVETDPEEVRYRRLQGHTLVLNQVVREVALSQGTQLDALMWPLLSAARGVVTAHVQDLSHVLGVGPGADAGLGQTWAQVLRAVGSVRPADGESLGPLVQDLLAVCEVVLDRPVGVGEETYLDADAVVALTLEVRDGLDGLATGLHEDARLRAEMAEDFETMH